MSHCEEAQFYLGVVGYRGMVLTAFTLRVDRHSAGYKLANAGQDTRAIQHYMGHRNSQHAVRYTELAPLRFKDFWKE